MTDDEFAAAIITAYEADFSPGPPLPPAAAVALLEEATRRWAAPTKASRQERCLFFSRLTRDLFLREEALEAGRDVDQIRGFLAWAEPLRWPENYPDTLEYARTRAACGQCVADPASDHFEHPRIWEPAS